MSLAPTPLRRPQDVPPYTQDSYRDPILSIVAINDKTASLVESDPTLTMYGGPWSMAFCKTCSKAPQTMGGPQLIYDYTAVASTANAIDHLTQTYYVILWNPRIGSHTRTLFGITRTTNFNTGSLTSPDKGIWDITLQASALQYYQVPDQIVTLASLKYSPRMTALQFTGEQPIGPQSAAPRVSDPLLLVSLQRSNRRDLHASAIVYQPADAARGRLAP